VVNFSKHQRIDRPTASKLATYFNSTSPRRALDEPSLLEGKGKERKGTGKGKEAAPEGRWVVALGIALPESLQTEPCLEAVQLWLTYKAERKDTYKKTGLSVSLNQWASEFTAATFPAAVHNAISKGWRGIYQPNNGHSNSRQGSGRASVIEERNAALGPDAAERAAATTSESRTIDTELLRRLNEDGISPWEPKQTEVPSEGPQS